VGKTLPSALRVNSSIAFGKLRVNPSQKPLRVKGNPGRAFFAPLGANGAIRG